MALPRFGGTWTVAKLDCVKKYLDAYSSALKNTRFHKLYIDAFAGAGYHKFRSKADQNGLDLGIAEELMKGSARQALDVTPPFQRYIFIEKDRGAFAELQRLEIEFPHLSDRIEFRNQDANDAIAAICQDTNWRSSRAVLFLDPYGMQVNWATIQAIARTQSIDLWYLFPVSAVQRLLPHGKGVPPPWARRLDLMLGTTEWRSHFYRESESHDLFGHESAIRQREADVDKIAKFFGERLSGIFAGVSKRPCGFVTKAAACFFCFSRVRTKKARRSR